MDKENQLKILTVNCQGLGETNKRKDVLNHHKAKNYNIYFIQDTHFVNTNENLIQTQWGYKVYFNSYRSNSRGVAILFNNNCDIKVHNQFNDNNGNYIILDVTVENLNFILVNIYGPNTDSPEFYKELSNKIEDIYSTQHLVLCGDFNLVLNKNLDTMNYLHLNNPNSRQEVLNLMDNFNLKDIYRSNNAELKRYTWRRKNPIKQARLDFILISESLQTMTPGVKFENSYR